MRRRVGLYLLCVALFAGLVTAAVFGFLYEPTLVAGIVSSVIAALVLYGFFAVVAQDNLLSACQRLHAEHRDKEAIELLDKASGGILFPMMRTTIYMKYVELGACSDDLELAERYIERLRFGAGGGWQFKTAYIYILIQLDREEIQKARIEYEDFRRHNLDVELYRKQLEVLDALFKRLFTRSDEPLPQSVQQSSFPVVQRILGKHFEKQAEEWN